MTGPVANVHVGDIRGGLRKILHAGAQPKQEITVVGGGKLIASAVETDGSSAASGRSPTRVQENDAETDRVRIRH
jgi:hypothetical protein